MRKKLLHFTYGYICVYIEKNHKTLIRRLNIFRFRKYKSIIKKIANVYGKTFHLLKLNSRFKGDHYIISTFVCIFGVSS